MTVRQFRKQMEVARRCGEAYLPEKVNEQKDS